MGIRFARERWVPRLCRAFVFDLAVTIVLLAPVGSLAKAHLLAEPKVTPAPLLAWLGQQTDAAAARTVYARWTWGHHVRALARRPALQVLMLGSWLLVLMVALWQWQAIDGVLCGVPR